MSGNKKSLEVVKILIKYVLMKQIMINRVMGTFQHF